MSKGGYPVKFSIDANYLCKWLSKNEERIAQTEWYEQCFDGEELESVEAWFFIKEYIMPLIGSNIQYDFGVDFDPYELIDVEIVRDDYCDRNADELKDYYDSEPTPVTSNEAVQFFQDKQKIMVLLHDDTFLVAEDCTPAEPDYKEIYIYVEKDGAIWQDLAFVREKYHYDDSQDRPVADHGQYEVGVYSDCYNEDFTHEFCIGEWTEEDNG